MSQGSWMKSRVNFRDFNAFLYLKYKFNLFLQPESDGSRSGSSLSLRNIANDGNAAGNTSVQSPTHRGVHRSISASSTKPSRRASSGGETLRKFNFFFILTIFTYFVSVCFMLFYCYISISFRSNCSVFINAGIFSILIFTPVFSSFKSTI